MGVMMPVISVVLPAFNAEKYVKEAVQSILDQTFISFELIVIDDGSTDGTLQVLQQLKELDERVILITRQNRGLVETLNEGIDHARGKWLARMDADDIALPNRFERQLQWLGKSDADICGSWVQFCGTADKRILKHPQSDAANKMELLFGCSFAHPTVMMKTELVRNLRYDKAWEKCEDYDLWERAARAGWKMTNVPEVLLLYRQHDAQVSTAASVTQQELTQRIRRRRWEFVSTSMNIEREWIAEVLKLREPLLPKFNINDVDSAFVELLHHASGEARITVFDHVTRIYFRAAADCPDIVMRWWRLNTKFGRTFPWGTMFQLLVLSVLRIRPGSHFFEKLKKFLLSKAV